MNSTGPSSMKSLASPSNVMTASLVVFLLVGQTTDWAMLRGSSSKARHAVIPAPPAYSGDSAKLSSPRLRSGYSPAARLKADPQSEVADRRPTPHEGTNHR